MRESRGFDGGGDLRSPLAHLDFDVWEEILRLEGGESNEQRGKKKQANVRVFVLENNGSSYLIRLDSICRFQRT